MIQMRVVALFAAGLSCLGGYMPTESAATTAVQEVSILVSTDGTVPYAEDQSGEILATFADNVFGSWIKMVDHGVYQSDLVKFAFSPDFKTLELSVKPTTQFHDGSAVTARDIEFSLLRGLYTEKASFYFGFLGCIEGVTDQPLSRDSGVAGIQVTSPSQIKISFRRPCPEILHALTLPYVGPRLRSQLTEDFIHFKGLPIGAGPYRVTSENQISGTYHLKRVSPTGPSPLLMTILTRSPNQTPDLSLNRAADGFKSDLKVVSSTNPSSTMTLFAGQKHRLFKNPGVRELLYYVFDREALRINDSYSPAYSLSLFGSTDEISIAAQTEAKRKLKGLLSQMPESDTQITIALYGSVDQTRQALLNKLTSQFAEVGLQVKFELLETKKFLSADDGTKYAFWLASLVIDPTAVGTMLSSFRAGSAFPFHSVDSQDLVNLFVTWEAASSETGKKEAAIALDDYISKSGYGIPLLRGFNTIYYNPKTILNLGHQTQILSVDFSEIRSKACSKSLAR